MTAVGAVTPDGLTIRASRHGPKDSPSIQTSARSGRSIGKTWLAYNDPEWLAKRHGADGGISRILGAMTAALQAQTRRR